MSDGKINNILLPSCCEKEVKLFSLFLNKNIFADAFKSFVKTWHLEMFSMNRKITSEPFYSGKNMLLS